MAQLNPVTLAITIGFALANNYLQRRKRAAAQRRLNILRSPEIESSDLAPKGQFAYGYTATNGRQVYFNFGKTFTSQTYTDSRGAVPTGTRNNDQFLLIQYELSRGDIDGLTTVLQNGEAMPTGHAIWQQLGPGTASDLATKFASDNGFASERDALSKFSVGDNIISSDNPSETGASHVTLILSRDRDNPAFDNFPVLEFFIRGRKLRTITSANAISTDRTFTNNAVYVLLDYLIDGCGIPVDKIDLKSFRNAALAADKTMQGVNAFIGSKQVPAQIKSWNDIDENDFTYGDWLSNYGISGTDSYAGYDSQAHIFQSNAAYTVKRHEFNGILDSSRPMLDNVNDILSSIPDAILDFDLADGKLFIDIVDLFVPKSSQATFDSDDYISPLSVSEPEGARTVLVGDYYSASDDFRPKSIRFPETGSNLETEFQSMDGSVLRSSTISFPGLISPQQVKAALANEFLQSRRKVYSWVSRNGFERVRPGDVVTVRESHLGIDEEVRVTDVVVGDTGIRFSGIEYDIIDYGWWPESADLYEGVVSASALKAVSSVTLNLTEGLASITWTVDSDSPASTEGYQFQNNIGGSWQGGGVALGLETNSAADSIGFKAHTGVKYRVRPFSSRSVGEWVESNSADTAGVSFGGGSTRWHILDGPPKEVFGENNEYAIDFSGESTRSFWQKVNGVWTKFADHPDDATWLSSASTPGSSLGANGNFHWNTATTTVSVKAFGSWIVLAILSNGSTWHFISTGTAPPSATGANGDFAYVSSNGFEYRKISGEWTFQRDITGVPPEPASTYNPPRTFTFSSIDDSTTLASWLKPLPSSRDASRESVEPTHFSGAIKLKTANVWPADREISADAPSFTLVNLNNNAEYDARVRAKYPGDNYSVYLTGSFTSGTNSKVNPIPVYSPGTYNPLRNPHVIVVGDDSILSWDGPLPNSRDTGGNVIDNDAVSGALVAWGADWPTGEAEVAGDTTAYTLTELGETRYIARARAKYPGPNYSTYIYFYFNYDLGLTLARNLGVVTAAWRAVPYAASYTISWGTTSAANDNSATQTSRTRTFPITVGTTLYVKIRANLTVISNIGTEFSAPVAISYSKLAAPVFDVPSFKIRPVNVELHWSTVTGADQYRLEWDDDPPASEFSATASAEMETVTGLTQGTDYYFRVRAEDTADPNIASDWSDTVTVTTTIPAKLATPRNLAVSPRDRGLHASWDAVLNADRYRLSHGSDSDADDSEIVVTGGTSHTIRPLTPNVARHVKVRAESLEPLNFPNSDYSAAVSGIPGAAPGVPGAPKLVRADGSRLSLVCTEPIRGGSATSYEWDYGTDTPATTTSNSVLITGLTNATKYRVRVRGVNQFGPGEYSNYFDTNTIGGHPLPAGLTDAAGADFIGTDIYVANDGTTKELWKIDQSDPSKTTGGYGKIGDLPSGLGEPGSVFHKSPDLYLTDVSDGSLWKIDPSDPGKTTGGYGRLGTFPADISEPFASTLLGGYAYTLDASDMQLWRIDPDNPGKITGTGGVYGRVDLAAVPNPSAMCGFGAVLRAAGRGASAEDGRWSMYEVTRTAMGFQTSNEGAFPLSLDSPDAMCMTVSTLCVIDSGAGRIWFLDPDDPDRIITPSGIPNAIAPTLTISDLKTVSEDETATLTATLTGGHYDTVSYAWTVSSGGGTITGTGASVTYTPPDVSADTNVTVSVTATVTGTGTNAENGTTSSTGTVAEEFTVLYVPPDASAPTISLNDVADFGELETATLTAVPTGGVYDTISYAWTVTSGGGTITGSGASVTYTPADVSADTSVTVSVTATAAGTGTNAKSGTTATSTAATETFTVKEASAEAPNLSINDVVSIVEENTATLTATPSGGLYDTLSYAWTVTSGGGTITGTGASVVYTAPNVASDTTVTVSVTATAAGTGTKANSGSSDTATVSESFQVLDLLSASAPTLAVTGNDSVKEGGDLNLTAAPTGGRYDAISYAWTVTSGGGTISGTGASVTYTAPALTQDASVRPYRSRRPRREPEPKPRTARRPPPPRRKRSRSKSTIWPPRRSPYPPPRTSIQTTRI